MFLLYNCEVYATQLYIEDILFYGNIYGFECDKVIYLIKTELVGLQYETKGNRHNGLKS